MSLQVLVSHTGERLLVNPTAFESLDTFKSWLAKTSSIANSNQILLTPSGKQAKQQALLVEKELFLYDRELISSNKQSLQLPKFVPEPALYTPRPPPATLQDQNDLSSWQQLFAARQGWASDVAQNCRSMAEEIQKRSDVLVVMSRGVAVAIGNLQSHVQTLEQKFSEAKQWADGLSSDQDALMSECKTTRSQLQELPATPGFLRLLPKLRQPADGQLDKPGSQKSTLKDLVVSRVVDTAIADLSAGRTALRTRIDSMASKVDTVVHDASELVQLVQTDRDKENEDFSDNVSQLLEEIDVVANKVKSDMEHVQSLIPQARNISQASRMALLHTRDHLPSMEQYAAEMREMLRHITDDCKRTPSISTDRMRRIAAIESAFSKVNNQITQLGDTDSSDNAMDLILLISQLPYIYGTLLIEAVKRKEWSDRLKDESSLLAEDIAGYREEEMKRRKKWIKNIGNLVDPDIATGDALNFELNIRSESNEWPSATREDITAYLQAMSRIQKFEDVHSELSEAEKDLDRPTKRQIKKAKGFKMGSFHETSSGRGSFLLRENDELRIAKDANSRLEDELKSQKSRIRRLEDLLYKQGQASRASSGNLFQGSLPQQIEPDPQNLLQRTQDPSGRKQSISSHQSRPSDDGQLARRVVALEAELNVEKTRIQKLEREREAKASGDAKLKADADEAISTKRDLMENMEAQQREFATERRSLEEEVSKYRNRAEDLEEELDRLAESRDNSKLTEEEKYRLVETDLAGLKKQNEALQKEISDRDEQQQEYFQTLTMVHSHFASEEVPKTFQDLVNGLDDLVGRSARHLKEVQQAVAAAKADKDSVQAALDRHDKQAAENKDHVRSLEEDLTVLRNESATEKARADAMSSELEDGRTQLRTLRAKFAEGETGSEALRQRVEEQASRASGLATQLAQSKSHVNSLDVELSSLQRKHMSLQDTNEDLARRLQTRAIHDRELTSRLVGHNEELRRLLETLGLSIIAKDGAMAIQRTSKLNNGSTELSQISGSAGNVARSVLGFDFSPSAEMIQWMQTNSADEEATIFRQFLGKVDGFSYHTFTEAIIKLRRDIEWTGKKWKSEARNYRDKFHRAYSEGHDKIAFRSFREGDLALFLPTRNQATRPWAAFNVGAPHYFLREQDSHKLQNREWLVARITKIEERVVNLSKTVDSLKATDGRSIGGNSEEGASYEDDNPFELSDGLRWYLVDATEERSGAPSTPGLGKTTVASAIVDVRGNIETNKASSGKDASSKLNKSLESRRSSTSSKRNSISIPAGARDGPSESPVQRVAAASHGRSTSNGSSNTGLGIEVAKSTGLESRQVSSSLPKIRAFDKQDDDFSRSPSIHISEPVSGGSPLRTGIPERPKTSESGTSTMLDPGARLRPLPRSSDKPATTRPKRTAWESLWTLDMNLEGGRNRKS